MAITAPFFTTRVGSCVVDHGSPDPRQARSPAKLRADPRCRFKTSYAPGGAGSPPSSPAHGARRPRLDGNREDGDAVGRRREAQLEMELQEAHLEIQQLRNALRASAHALQHASGLLPPEANQDVEAQRQILDDLTRQLMERDSEILVLKRRTGQLDEAAGARRSVALTAMRRWADERGSLLVQEIFVAWKPLQKERHLEKEFQAALEKARLLDADKVARVVQGLFGNSLGAVARAALSSWSSVASLAKGERSRKKLAEERRSRAALRLGAGGDRQLQEVCLAFWRRWHERCQGEKKADEVRVEHLRVARELKKQSVMKTTLAFAGRSDGALSDYTLRMVLRVWLEALLEGRARKRVEVERQRAQAAQERYNEHLHRNFVLLTNQGSKQMLGALFATWLDLLTAGRLERQAERERWLQATFKAWQVLALNDRRGRELDNERARLAELEREHEEQVRKGRNKRNSLMGFLDSVGPEANTTLLLHGSWSAWREHVLEERRERERAAERSEWEQEFNQRREEELTKERGRSLLIAFSVQEKAENDVGNRLLLTVAWSSWFQFVESARRDKELDNRRRIFEDDQRKTLHEAEKIRDEAAQASLRHQDAEKRRKLVFLMSLEDSRGKAQDDMLLQTMFASWQRCWQDSRVDAERVKSELLGQQVTELREALLRISEPSLAPSASAPPASEPPAPPEPPPEPAVAPEAAAPEPPSTPTASPRAGRRRRSMLARCCSCMSTSKVPAKKVVPKSKEDTDGFGCS
eukprot:TRINITY_DN11821_c0_g1_i1.p1 TRINITY_DN11821_c0_g1~~TRINITY_DN11821_c0_g1_i1.p1  ORF type:complete len:756 (+),score=222.27 TRINITY_DN11821_c0_g1_i1:166-2433(+)